MSDKVIIRDREDSRISVIYCPPGSLESKVLIVPRRDFLEACSEYADRVAREAEKSDGNS
jgi:hypothetical protein